MQAAVVLKKGGLDLVDEVVLTRAWRHVDHPHPPTQDMTSTGLAAHRMAAASEEDRG